MGFIVFFLGMIGFIVFFVYIKFPPPYATKKLISVFNKMVLAVTLLFCGAFYWNGRLNLPLSDDLREIVALAGAIGIEIVFLTVCFLLRNFWVFKPPKRPGTGGWF